MPAVLRKAAAVQLPAKFNFLAGRRPPSHNKWPLRQIPREAQILAASCNKRGAK